MSNQKQSNDTTESTRVKNFRDALNNLEWEDNKRLENLKTIFTALHNHASNDLKYYDDHREKSRNSSRRTIRLAIIFSALGAIFFVLQAVNPPVMVAIGSACFIIAAASIAWNKYLCVSNGHIRYVIAQFDLGKAINKFELDWQEWLNKYNHTTQLNGEATDAAFKLFNGFTSLIYEIIRNDTEKWSKSLTDAVYELEKKVNKMNSSTN